MSSDMSAMLSTISAFALPALLAMAGIAAVYQLLTLAAGIRHLLRTPPATPAELPAISILKPLRGLDHGLNEALESFASQDYPEFEMIFAVADPNDPAIPVIRKVMAAHPERPSRLLVIEADLPNRKVAKLSAMEAVARNPVLLISDADILAPPGYLKAVAAALDAPGVGLVTAIYRARAKSFAGRWEALGISTDFSPSALVGRLIGVSEFALGSTIAMRKDLLDSIGGCRAVGEYIADDYHLGRLVRERDLRIALLREPVETALSAESWGDVWQHQLRWARTIRASRPDGYAGLPVTSASLWALLLLLTPYWLWGAALLALRMIAGSWLARVVLHDRSSLAMLLLQPFRDLWAFAIWLWGFSGRTVEWRGQRLVLNRRGVIVTEPLN
ncbi:MAG: bacteriohopanetetrol glucosamine biosynthesis glycosyltransferase HpnI [Bryobacterales bacterium]|nr:bacteriohopanetetrol glucosamine biosynthesis glycosyltransferase HpnI [Bryobacterales bacterium]